MIKKILLLSFAIFSLSLSAQIGVNNPTPDLSAALDITSTTGGVLVPRMTLNQRDAIESPATGLMIYQTNSTSGFYYYNGSLWTAIEGATGGTCARICRCRSESIFCGPPACAGPRMQVTLA